VEGYSDWLTNQTALTRAKEEWTSAAASSLERRGDLGRFRQKHSDAGDPDVAIVQGGSRRLGGG